MGGNERKKGRIGSIKWKWSAEKQAEPRKCTDSGHSKKFEGFDRKWCIRKVPKASPLFEGTEKVGEHTKAVKFIGKRKFEGNFYGGLRPLTNKKPKLKEDSTLKKYIQMPKEEKSTSRGIIKKKNVENDPPPKGIIKKINAQEEFKPKGILKQQKIEDNVALKGIIKNKIFEEETKPKGIIKKNGFQEEAKPKGIIKRTDNNDNTKPNKKNRRVNINEEINVINVFETDGIKRKTSRIKRKDKKKLEVEALSTEIKEKKKGEEKTKLKITYTDISAMSGMDNEMKEETKESKKVIADVKEEETTPSGVIKTTKLDKKITPAPVGTTVTRKVKKLTETEISIRRSKVQEKVLKKFPFLKKYCSSNNVHVAIIFNENANLNRPFPKVFWYRCRCTIPQTSDIVEKKSKELLGLVFYVKCRRHAILLPLCMFVRQETNQ